LRVLVEIDLEDGGQRLDGHVLVEGGSASTPFSGWLELLSLLEQVRSLPPANGRKER
jgi:hypothetical protein